MNARVIIFILLSSFILLTPGRGEAIPDAAHAMDPEKSVWRNYFRDKFFVEIHSSKALLKLSTLQSEDTTIGEAVRLRLEDKWKDAIDLLSERMSDPEAENLGELIYTTALIYESVGFYTEAAGNYSRLDEYAEGDELLNARFRQSFATSINAVKYGSFAQLVEADLALLKVFRRSDDKDIWSSALAGHAVILYIFNNHRSAEKIFEKLEEGGLLTSQYHFIRAENFMSLGYLDEAEFLFSNLMDYALQNTMETFQSYIYLRLGDIAAMRGDFNGAEVSYNKMKIDWELKPGDPDFIGDDHYVMRTMAAAEVSILKNKMAQALKLLDDVSTVEVSLSLGMDRSIALYRIFLYADSGLGDEAFAAAKHFLLIYGKTPWQEDVWEVIDNYIYKEFADSYANEDYYSIVKNYYKNIRYVRKRRSLLLASESFLAIDLPMESKKIYEGLLSDVRGQSVDLKAISGLVKSHILLQENASAQKLLKGFKPRSGKEKLLKANLTRDLAGSFYRSGEYADAIGAFADVRKTLPFDAGLELRYARSLLLTSRESESIWVYKDILTKSDEPRVHAECLIGIGKASFNLKRYGEGLRALRRAAGIAGEDERPRVFYMLGETSHKLGRRTDAKDAWKMSVETGMDSDYVELSRERLKEITQWERARM